MATALLENSRPHDPTARARRARSGRPASCASRPLSLLLFAALAPVTLPLPAAAQELDADLIRARCRAVHDIEDQSLVYGMVIDARTGTPLPGSSVHLLWKTARGVADTVTNHVETPAPDGMYIFCDVPQHTRLTTWADAAGSLGQADELFFEGGESERRDLFITFRQVTGAVVGRVIDSSTGLPVEAAHVSIPGTDRGALSDADGRFRIHEVPVGGVEARIRHVAYGEPTVEFRVEPRQTTHVEIRLTPAAIAVEPLTVVIDVRPQWLEANGFYERQERGLGQFVTPEELANTPFRRFSEVLRNVPGVVMRNVCTPHCYQVIRMSTSASQGCPPTFYVDGKKMTTVREEMIDLDALAPNADLAAVEVYRGISQTPPQYYGRCGSIVIWTLRGG